MHRAKVVFEELKQKFERTYFAQANAIHWLSIGDSSSEDYHIQYAHGKITVKTHGYLGAIHAIQAIQTGIASGHLVHFLGPRTPHFKLRPLCLDEDIKTVSLNPEQLHKCCTRILELGYNAILIDELDNPTQLKNLCTQVKSYGLKILLKPSFLQIQKLKKHSPLNKVYQDSLTDYLKDLLSNHLDFDYLFWESNWQTLEFIHDPNADQYTLSEIMHKEARLLESILNPSKNLVFYVPAIDEHVAKQCTPWIPSLADDLKQDTILAFSAVAGDFFSDFLPIHPLWNQLRLKKEASSAAFMPILNIGNVKQGEGLWPILVDDFIDECIGRSHHAHFSGILSIAKHLPNEGGLHACNLWVASQAMWKPKLPAFLWQETWFSAYRPDWNAVLYRSLLKQIRVVSRQLHALLPTTKEINHHHLSSQECRLTVESILAQINDIHARLEKEEKKRIRSSDAATLWDYFTFFAIDVRRIILHILQRFNISTPSILDENEIKESFWTEFSKQSSQLRSNNRISFLESPNKGLSGSRMSLIYQENRLF